MNPTPFESHRADIERCLKILRAAIAAEQRRLDGAASLSMEELVTAYAHAKDFHELMDEVRKEQYHVANAYKESVLPQRLLDQGVKSFSTDFYRAQRTTRVTVTMLDKEKCLEWLRKNELADIITETANAQTLGKIAEERLEQNKDFPEDLFKTTTSMSTTLTKLK